jgi:hypothetical protein
MRHLTANVHNTLVSISRLTAAPAEGSNGNNHVPISRYDVKMPTDTIVQ